MAPIVYGLWAVAGKIATSKVGRDVIRWVVRQATKATVTQHGNPALIFPHRVTALRAAAKLTKAGGTSSLSHAGRSLSKSKLKTINTQLRAARKKAKDASIRTGTGVSAAKRLRNVTAALEETPEIIGYLGEIVSKLEKGGTVPRSKVKPKVKPKGKLNKPKRRK